MRVSRYTTTAVALVMSVQIVGAQTRSTRRRTNISPQDDVQLGREGVRARLSSSTVAAR
jgi:hypothetical protein